MSINFGKRAVTSTRIEYFVETPVNLTELCKIQTIVSQDLSSRGIAYYDNTVLITCRDEEIVIYFNLEETIKEV